MSGEGSIRWSGFRMKKEKRSKAPVVLLGAALVCFGFDLFHFGHHLLHDPALLGLPGVSWKLAWKGAIFLGTLLLLIFSRRVFLGVFGIFLGLSYGIAPVLAAQDGADCEQALELMEASGMARDAKEDFLGRVKITPPRSSFPPEMDKVTWWGTFKPFEFWRSPEFEATWIDPQGASVSRTRFRGGNCQLAKTTLQVEGLPQGKLRPGMWRVVVSCGEVVIDNHPFAVIGSPSSAQDAMGKDSGVMIWADEVR